MEQLHEHFKNLVRTGDTVVPEDDSSLNNNVIYDELDISISWMA